MDRRETGVSSLFRELCRSVAELLPNAYHGSARFQVFCATWHRPLDFLAIFFRSFESLALPSLGSLARNLFDPAKSLTSSETGSRSGYQANGSLAGKAFRARALAGTLSYKPLGFAALEPATRRCSHKSPA
jgi:hypothetical protein